MKNFIKASLSFIMAIAFLLSPIRLSNGHFSQIARAIENSDVYVTKIPDKVVKVAAGSGWSANSASHSLILTECGDVWACGANSYGQLGFGSVTYSEKTPRKIPNLAHVRDIDAGQRLSLAITDTNELWAWGQNSYNILSQDSTSYYASPVKIADDVVDVAAGNSNILILKSNGDLYAQGYWGYHNSVSSDVVINRLVKVSSNIKSIDSGYYHSLAIATNGDVYAFGAYGLGSTAKYYGSFDGVKFTLSKINGVINAKKVICGDNHSFAITTSNELWGWGANSDGRLGTSQFAAWNTFVNPTKIMDNVKDASGGCYHSLFLKNSGELYTSGRGFEGQLGVSNPYDNYAIPQLIMTEMSAISAGERHSLGVKADGDMFAWGSNDMGQLGAGDGHPQINTPTLIMDNVQNPISIPVVSKPKKAIYILPGFMGSRLYDISNDLAWVNNDVVRDDVLNAFALKSTLFTLNNDGSGSKLHAYLQGGGSPDDYSIQDPYGTDDAYKNLFQALLAEFGSQYDVIFYNYNWLGDLNESAQLLANDIDKKGYDKVVLVTHSTGGLLAATYIASSNKNVAKVERAVLIAAPLLGTLTSLEPVETGKTLSLDKMLKTHHIENDFGLTYPLIHSWVQQVTENSPTTYQLMPGVEYCKILSPIMTKDPFGDYKPVSGKNYYATINKSPNMNRNLTNGNQRSNSYIRDVVFCKDIVTVLKRVNTTLIGSSGCISRDREVRKRFLTPYVANYIDSPSAGCRLVDICYDYNGDGTVPAISAFAAKSPDECQFQYADFCTLNFNHDDLAKKDEAIDCVIDVIHGKQPIVPIASQSTQNGTSRMLQSINTSDLGLVKAYIQADQCVRMYVYDIAGNLVASALGSETVGFVESDLIFTSFSEAPNSTNATLYLPNTGYKIVFSYGDEAGVPINLGVSLSTLDGDGVPTSKGSYIATVTKDQGELIRLDMTSIVVDSQNIGSLSSSGDVPVQNYYDQWETMDSLTLNSIGETADIALYGDDVVLGNINVDDLSWTSSDPTVATVSEYGTVTATGYGTTAIYATAKDSSGRTKLCEVKVRHQIDNLVISNKNLVAGSQVPIDAVISPDTATEIALTYSYDVSRGVISIDENDVVHALASGTVDVIATAPSGISATFRVVVCDIVQIHNFVKIDLTKRSGSNGSLTVYAAGGSGSYEYSIDDGASWHDSSFFSNMPAGTYKVRARDKQNQVNESTLEILELIEPQSVTFVYRKGDATAYGAADGTIHIDATGGLGDYEFSVDGGITWQTSADFLTLNAGLYCLMARDSVDKENVSSPTDVSISEPNLQHVVSFDSKGGNEISIQTVDHNGFVIEPEDPVRQGYSFIGWYKEPSYISAWNFASDTVTADITLYAAWSAKSYTVTFKDWNGDILKTEEVHYESAATAPADPKRMGYTFAGWDKAFDCITDNLIVTAQYTINRYTVTFDKNGGTTEASPMTRTADYNTTVELPAPPARRNSSFVGWNTRADGTGESFTAATVVKDHITVYAQWLTTPEIVSPLRSTYNSLRLNWAASQYATGYEVYCATSPTGNYTLIATVTGTSYTSNNLVTSQSYYFMIRAYRSGSPTLYAGYSPIVFGRPVPAAPVAFSAASASYTSIKVSWIAVSGASGYEVYRATTRGGIFVKIVTTSALTFTNTSLNTGSMYYYKARAYRTINGEKVYGPFTVTKSARPTIAIPVSVRAVRASATSVNVTWDAVAGASGYELWFSTSPFGTYVLVKSTASLYYTSTHLTTGKTYYFKVRAYQIVGSVKVYSGFSVVVNATP